MSTLPSFPPFANYFLLKIFVVFELALRVGAVVFMVVDVPLKYDGVFPIVMSCLDQLNEVSYLDCYLLLLLEIIYIFEKEFLPSIRIEYNNAYY